MMTQKIEAIYLLTCGESYLLQAKSAANSFFARGIHPCISILPSAKTQMLWERIMAQHLCHYKDGTVGGTIGSTAPSQPPKGTF